MLWRVFPTSIHSLLEINIARLAPARMAGMCAAFVGTGFVRDSWPGVHQQVTEVARTSVRDQWTFKDVTESSVGAKDGESQVDSVL